MSSTAESSDKRPREGDADKEQAKRLKPTDPRKSEVRQEEKRSFVEAIEHAPGEFEPENHFYDRVLNAQIHPMVSSFMALSVERMATRYCQLHPRTNFEALVKYLRYEPRHFRWAGSDLFNVADADSRRQMVVVETNSCPSGQKSMPGRDDTDEAAGYGTLLADTFLPLVAQNFHDDVKDGVLAVIFDKNPMEASGYAAQLATLANETVYRVQYHAPGKQPDPPVRWSDDGQICSVRLADGSWRVCRAVFRYVTQQPWNRLPLESKTRVMNPIVACLAGGRNKATAAKAYDVFNAELAPHGLEIRVPETVKDVSKREVPMWVKSFGGHAVVKDPFSNAGQGVYTITSREELDEFMAGTYTYDKFIVQALVGHSNWTSVTRHGQFFHSGTVPDKRNQTFACDVRMMVGARPNKGFRPVAVYARRAAKPLVADLAKGADSWGMLGTNLSKKDDKGEWVTETNRLLLMDRRDFNKLGLGIDDLIDGYVQTSLACIAIDKMCCRLVRADGTFNFPLFASLVEDEALLAEIRAAPGASRLEKSDAELAAEQQQQQ